MNKRVACWAAIALLVLMCGAASAQNTSMVGEVVTADNLMGPDDTVAVLRFDDPKVAGAACYLSSSQKGGFAANFNLQEDRSEYVLDCFAKGPIALPAGLPRKEVIREASRSVLFKKMYVVRFVDPVYRRLVYVAYTRYLVDGSPKHATSSLPYGP